MVVHLPLLKSSMLLLICLRHNTSVTKWLDYFFKCWHFYNENLTIIRIFLAKVCSKQCQILNQPTKIFQRLLIFCLSGEILPNLVTLHNTYYNRSLPVSLLATHTFSLSFFLSCIHFVCLFFLSVSLAHKNVAVRRIFLSLLLELRSVGDCHLPE